MKVILICAAVMLTFIALGAAAIYVRAPLIAMIFWSFSLLTVGFILYRLKLRSRMWYSCLQLLVAIAAAYFVLLNQYEQPVAAFSGEVFLSRIIIFFGAVFVMIGALNNIEEALSPAWRFMQMWNRLFRN